MVTEMEETYLLGNNLSRIEIFPTKENGDHYIVVNHRDCEKNEVERFIKKYPKFKSNAYDGLLIRCVWKWCKKNEKVKLYPENGQPIYVHHNGWLMDGIVGVLKVKIIGGKPHASNVCNAK